MSFRDGFRKRLQRQQVLRIDLPVGGPRHKSRKVSARRQRSESDAREPVGDSYFKNIRPGQVANSPAEVVHRISRNNDPKKEIPALRMPNRHQLPTVAELFRSNENMRTFCEPVEDSDCDF